MRRARQRTASGQSEACPGAVSSGGPSRAVRARRRWATPAPAAERDPRRAERERAGGRMPTAEGARARAGPREGGGGRGWGQSSRSTAPHPRGAPLRTGPPPGGPRLSRASRRRSARARAPASSAQISARARAPGAPAHAPARVVVRLEPHRDAARGGGAAAKPLRARGVERRRRCACRRGEGGGSGRSARALWRAHAPAPPPLRFDTDFEFGRQNARAPRRTARREALRYAAGSARTFACILTKIENQFVCATVFQPLLRTGE